MTLPKNFEGVRIALSAHSGKRPIPNSKIYLGQGADAAARLSSARMRLALPDHPLDVVDVDYTTLDVFVFDPTSRFAFGRPNILVFRDATRALCWDFTSHSVHHRSPASSLV